MSCQGCGRPFEPRRRDQRWCSARCRLAGYQQKQAEAEAARQVRDAAIRRHAEAIMRLLGQGGSG